MILVLFVIGCKPKSTDSKKVFDSNKWEQGKTVSLKLKTDKAVQHQKLIIHISHVDGIQFPVLPIQIAKKSPDGKIEKMAINLEFVDKSGERLSDCSGDYCDYKSVIDSNFTMTPNEEYQFDITNDVKLPYIPGIMQMELIIE